MIATKTRGANKVFTKPRGWDDATDVDCFDLEVRMQPFGKRLVDFISTWKPSLEELARLNNGGVIEVSIVGSQPPLRLDVVAPVPELSKPAITINEDAHGLG